MASVEPIRRLKHSAGRTTMSQSNNEELIAINRKLRWLVAAVFLVAFALLLLVSAVLGAIIDFHYGEALLIGSACAGGTVMGFLFGWLARRAAGPRI